MLFLMAFQAAGFQDGKDLFFEINGSVLSGYVADRKSSDNGGEGDLGFHWVGDSMLFAARELVKREEAPIQKSVHGVHGC